MTYLTSPHSSVPSQLHEPLMPVRDPKSTPYSRKSASLHSHLALAHSSATRAHPGRCRSSPGLLGQAPQQPNQDINPATTVPNHQTLKMLTHPHRHSLYPPLITTLQTYNSRIYSLYSLASLTLASSSSPHPSNFPPTIQAYHLSTQDLQIPRYLPRGLILWQSRVCSAPWSQQRH